MNVSTVDGESLAVLKRLIAETGTAQVLRLVADLARQHAEDLLKRGAGADAARFAREAKILAKASHALGD
jgi:hypothetical protein